MAKQAAAAETESGFKALSEDNRNWMKSLEDAGWRFSYDDATGWSAVKEFDGEASEHGPHDSFMVMMNQVEKAEKSRGGEVLAKGTKKQTHDAKGQGYIPGAEPIVVSELIELAKRRIELVKEHKRLTSELIEINDDCLNASEKHREHFTEDPVSHSLMYKAAGLELEIQHNESIKVKTRYEDPDAEE